MQSGCFGKLEKFDQIERVRKKIHKFNYPHTHHGTDQTVIGYVQATILGRIGENEVIEGVVVDEQEFIRSKLEKEKDGTYVIKKEHLLEPDYSEFTLPDDGFQRLRKQVDKEKSR